MNFARNDRGMLEFFLSPLNITAQNRDANTGNNNEIINRNIKKIFFKDKTKQKKSNHNFHLFFYSLDI